MNLIIIDDVKVTRTGLLKHIDWQNFGFDEIKMAESGLSAINICQNFKPDLVLSDIKMHGIDGVETCKQLRSMYEDIQIIFISGYSDKAYLKGAIELSAVNYIDKPVNLSELRSAVKKATEMIEKIKLVEKYRQNAEQISDELIDTEEIDKSSTVSLINTFIMNNYTDKDLSIKKISDAVFLTPTYLSGMYKRKTDKTIGEFITSVRVEQAKKLLADKNLKLYNISSMVGYENSDYFAKIFKKATGLTPSVYRDKML